MTRRLVLTVALVLLWAVPASAQQIARPQTFDCAGLYEAGEYRDAASCFENLESQGNTNGHLLYNLGNARYRAGQLGHAILAWRRAELYLPRDGDLRANLDRARSLTRDDLEPPGSREAVARALLAPYDALSASELLFLGALGWALLLGIIAVRLVREFAGWGALAAIAAVAAVLGLVGWSARSYQVARHPVAVVITEEVTVRSGRDVLSTDLARLHEGAEAETVERADDWVQVALSTGQRGWVPSSAVGLVEPTASE